MYLFVKYLGQQNPAQEPYSELVVYATSEIISLI